MRFILYFIRQVYKQWFLIFAAIIGLVSGILAIFPLSETSNITKLTLFLACLGVSILATLVVNQIKHIPDDEIWMLEEPRDKPAIAFPYKKTFLKAANLLARSHYGKSSIPYDIVQKWYEKNPFALTILTDAHNKFVGYFDILPLEPGFGKDLVVGAVKEKDIRHHNILSPSEMKNADYIYFAGVSVKDQLTQLGRKHGAILIYAAMVYLETFYDLSKPKRIYAIAASECGKNILEKLKFQIETDETNRKDKLDLYSRTITKEEIDNFRKKFAFCEDKFDYSAYTNSLANLKEATAL
jgi:hypothetical protein